MGLTKYLPFENYTLETKLSATEVRARLEANIDPGKVEVEIAR